MTIIVEIPDDNVARVLEAFSTFKHDPRDQPTSGPRYRPATAAEIQAAMEQFIQYRVEEYETRHRKVDPIFPERT